MGSGNAHTCGPTHALGNHLTVRKLRNGLVDRPHSFRVLEGNCGTVDQVLGGIRQMYGSMTLVKNQPPIDQFQDSRSGNGQI